MSNETPSTFLASLNQAASRKYVSIQELFEEYDKAKTGSVSQYHFFKILSSLGLWMNEDRMKQILGQFVEGDRFLYRQFLNNEAQDVKADAGLLQDLGVYLKNRAIDINDTLRPFDIHRSGRVSVNDFLRGLGTTPLTKKVADAYRIPGSQDIPYSKLSREIADLLKNSTFSNSKKDISDYPAFMSKVAETIRVKNIDPKSIFLESDPLKRQTISKRQFVTACSRFGLDLTPSEMESLSSTFSEANQCNYSEFCSVISELNSKRQPTLSAPPVQIDIDTVIRNFARDLKNRHSQVLEELRKYDTSKSGFLPANLFVRILSLSDFKFSKEELNALLDRFGRESFNYSELFQIAQPVVKIEPDVKPIIERLRQFLLRRRIQLRPLIDNSLESLFKALDLISFDIPMRERRLFNPDFNADEFCEMVDPHFPKNEVIQEIAIQKPPRNLPTKEISEILSIIPREIYEEFRVQDQLRRGFVTHSIFTTKLMYFGVSREDVEKLVKEYSCRDGVNYRDFIEDMDKVPFREVRKEVKVREQPREQVQFVKYDEREIASLLNSIKAKAMARRKRIDAVFDHLEGDTISFDTFRRCLDKLDLVLYDADVHKLCRVFRVNPQNDIDYKAFVASVNRSSAF